MNVLFFTYSNNAGIVRSLVDIAIAIAKQEEISNFGVIIINREHEIDVKNLLVSNISNIFEIRDDGSLNLHNIYHAVKELSNIILSNRTDIIHVSGIRQLIISRLAVKICGSKTKIIAAEHCPAHYENTFSAYATSFVLNNFAKMIVPCSSIVRHILIRHGLNKNRSCTIYNGKDLAKFDSLSDNILSIREIVKCPVVSDYRIVVTSGSMCKDDRKGHKILLNAAKKVLNINSKVYFLFVGDGPGRKNLEKYCKDLNIQENVIFTGFIKNDLIPCLLKRSDIFAFPSFQENLPMSIIEAMAAGLPIVATPVGGVSEMVVNGINGYLIPFNDPGALAKKIIYLLDNPEIAQQMGKQSRRIAEERFDINKIAQQWIKLYKSLL